MTEDDKYKLMVTEKRLLEMVVNPEDLSKSVTECVISLT